MKNEACVIQLPYEFMLRIVTPAELCKIYCFLLI